MYWNGNVMYNTYNVVLLMIICSSVITIGGQKQNSLIQSIPEQITSIALQGQLDDISGNLYDVFKRRLQVIENELTYHKINENFDTNSKYDIKNEAQVNIKNDMKNEDSKRTKMKNTSSNSKLNQRVNVVINPKSASTSMSMSNRKFDNTKILSIENSNFKPREIMLERNSISGKWVPDSHMNVNLSTFKGFRNNFPYSSKSCNIIPVVKHEKIVDDSSRQKLISWFKRKTDDDDTLQRDYINIAEIDPNSKSLIKYKLRKISFNDRNTFDENDVLFSKWKKSILETDDDNSIKNIFLEEYRKKSDLDKRNLRNVEDDYDLKENLGDIKMDFKIERRDTDNIGNKVLSNTLKNTTPSLYPSVLTKALEISLNPFNKAASGNLLANVAQKMNTSTLQLAQQIAKSDNLNSFVLQNDSRINKLIENYISKTVSPTKPVVIKSQPLAVNDFYTSNTISHPTSSLVSNSNMLPINNVFPITSEPYFHQSQIDFNSVSNSQFSNNDNHNHSIGNPAAQIAAILNKVLFKLENIQNEKNEILHPNGAPCDILGIWNSQVLGYCFNIQLNNEPKFYNSLRMDIYNKDLNVDIQECVPPKHHNYINLDWKFTGSARRQLGGPFYLHGQKEKENFVATFLGFCRTCGDTDSIFGLWTFLSPSKDCIDIQLSFDVKHDVLRRDRMESKRRDRFKDLLYQNRGKKN